jgi:uncharacterized protein (DUF2147 family)
MTEMKGVPLQAFTAVSLLAAAALAAPMAGAASADQALGRWSTPSKHGDSIRANPAFADGKNKDAALRTRPLKGMTILKGFTRTKDGWDGGSIYNPEDGGTYKATITVVDADTLKLKGCIVWPLCKTQTWKRLR